MSIICPFSTSTSGGPISPFAEILLAVASGATSIASPWKRLNSVVVLLAPSLAYTSLRYALQGLEAEAVEQAFYPRCPTPPKNHLPDDDRFSDDLNAKS